LYPFKINLPAHGFHIHQGSEGFIEIFLTDNELTMVANNGTAAAFKGSR